MQLDTGLSRYSDLMVTGCSLLFFVLFFFYVECSFAYPGVDWENFQWARKLLPAQPISQMPFCKAFLHSIYSIVKFFPHTFGFTRTYGNVQSQSTVFCS